MAEIKYRGLSLQCAPGQTVLERLEADGCAPPSSCRTGQCQTCLMRAKRGAVPAQAQVGLKDSWRAQGLFLACVCCPDQDLEVVDPTEVAPLIEATIVSRERVAPKIWRVRLRPEAAFAYRAGQFVTVVRPSDRLSRPYSLASVPALDPYLELHVQRVQGGKMTQWLCETVQVGDTVQLRGPAGNCFYLAESSQPLLLVGTATGLAPLIGVVRDALNAGHRGPVSLYHGSRNGEGLYLRAELDALVAKHGNLRVVRRVLEGASPDGAEAGSLEDAVFDDKPALADAKAFLCGAPAFVGKLKRRLFLAGMSLGSISSDPFESAAPPPS
ncbi:MAG: 2Fe-2S iron-sulfur cluster binding domain-containing protein [Nannocystaceae bacterium]|nr:2Fe-2S iron-sulfur cluster binding domain-containing protein [Nannocystaceae bacterium]